MDGLGSVQRAGGRRRCRLTWCNRRFPPRNLLKLKQKWDPTGLLTARRAVGSEIVGY